MARSGWATVAATATLICTGACAGNPSPGDRGYPYNVTGVYDAEFEAMGVTYAGPAEVLTGAAGRVSGSIHLAGPEDVVGDLNGTVSGDTLTFESTYERTGGCLGVLMGTGRIAAGGGSVSGTAVVDDECAGDLFEATFDLTRRVE